MTGAGVNTMTAINVQISPEVARLLQIPVNGCSHPRHYLVLVDHAQIFCIGCGLWFYPVVAEAASEDVEQ